MRALVVICLALSVALAKEAKNATGRCEVSATCLENVHEATVFARDKVSNFLKQKSRIDVHLGIGSKKMKKKAEFTAAADVLKSGLGGDSKKFICGVKNTGKLLTNATTEYTTLTGCSDRLNTACTRDTTKYSTTMEDKIKACHVEMKAYVKKIDTCVKAGLDVEAATASAVCKCWSEAVTLVTKIKTLKCDASVSAKAVTGMKSKCLSAVVACKKSMLNVPAILGECQVDPNNADKTVDEIKSNA